ncbi:glycoside hydrolase family 43 protein [Cadophora sp. DSE1049]|nr:glycoside hydrolase family 43 protein [Cadophora sp. DSE1049]
MGSSTFSNPIIPGFAPDPSICVVPPTTPATKTSYFLTTSTFNLFPSCAIHHSTDLLNWKLIGHALTRKSQIEMRTPEAGGGSWASTLRYRVEDDGEGKGGKAGRWYLCTGVFARYRPQMDERIFPRGFYVTTTNIWDSSSWSDPVYFDNPGFDQDLFWDNDGKVYLSTTVRMSPRTGDPSKKDFAIHISEISLPTGTTLTAPVVIRESPFGIAEGSHIIKRGKYYYLFTAEGGTEQGHQEWVFRSTEGVFGPWEANSKGGPLWYNGPEEEVQRTGHVDVFEDGEGRWWAVLLGVRPMREEGGTWLEPQLGRETFLVGVEWVDDWPVFNGGKNVGILTEGPEGVVQMAKEMRWKANLSYPNRRNSSAKKNTPLKKCWSLSERPGWLAIHGGCYTLTSPEAPTMLLRRQTAIEQLFSVLLDFEPNKAGYEAGLVLWWDMHSFASVGVTLTSTGKRSIIFKTPTNTPDQFEEQICPLESTGQVALKITATKTSYLIGVSSLASGDKVTEVTVKSKSLTKTPPVGQPFLGAMFGLYAFGNWEPCLDPVYFKDICCQNS